MVYIQRIMLAFIILVMFAACVIHVWEAVGRMHYDLHTAEPVKKHHKHNN